MGLIVILFFFGLAGAAVARIKGNSAFTWFLVSFCMPFIGLLAAVLWRRDDDELRRQCPACSQVVMLHDAVCMKCGYELEFPDVAVAPRAAMRSR